MSEPKRAYLVYGPEASGNRLMGRLLIAAGCIGDGGHAQRWETKPPTDETPIVWVRSLPLGTDHRWPDVPEHIMRLEDAGYQVVLVILVRDMIATSLSQIAAGHVEHRLEAEQNMLGALQTLLDAPKWAATNHAQVVTYEAIAGGLPYVNALLDRLGLPALEKLPEPIYDGNAKYYS